MPPKPLSKKPSSPPPLPNAARVYQNDTVVGVLGGAPGPFISARRDKGGSVGSSLAQVRYTSQAYPTEKDIRPLLHGSYAQVVRQLRAAGYRVEPAPYAELFDIPVEPGEITDPEALDRIQRDLEDL